MIDKVSNVKEMIQNMPPQISFNIKEDIKTNYSSFEYSDKHFVTTPTYNQLAVYDENKKMMIAHFKCSDRITSFSYLHKMKTDDSKNNYSVIVAMTIRGSLEMCLISD
jgi:hypothetical protein